MKKLVLLINIGTPSSPSYFPVAKYLSKFLCDKFIINMNGLLRYLLVHLIVIPRRVALTTKKYQRVWTNRGSPLQVNHQKLTNSLQAVLPENYLVCGAMRYCEPSIYNCLKNIDFKEVSEIIVVPLHPQYAASTSETAIQKTLAEIKRLKIDCNLKIIEQFYHEPTYIEALSKHIKTYSPEEYDFVLFSYHGLPLSQTQIDIDEYSKDKRKIEFASSSRRRHDYVQSCEKTTELLANSLNLSEDKYTSAFQSRFSKDRTKPYTDNVLKELIKMGKKKVLVVSPSFVADCLETIGELGIEYKEDFLSNGGEKYTLVESLNDQPNWVMSLAYIIME